MNKESEFDRQAENLLRNGYPELAGLSNEAFLHFVDPLKEKLPEFSSSDKNPADGYIPFVIVVKSDLVPSEKAMSLVERQRKKGFVNMYPHVPDDFATINSVSVPDTKVYLLTDIDRGAETINVRPNDALKIIQKQKRSPLTIDEGIALVTHFPEFLQKNNCFSLLASRVAGNQRVPAIWITGEKTVRLGWCWDGNPHTWLGSASCSARVG